MDTFLPLWNTPLPSQYNWLLQLPQHCRSTSFPWHTEPNPLIKQTPHLPPVFQPLPLKFDWETSLLHVQKVRDWSPLIKDPTCPHTYMVHNLCGPYCITVGRRRPLGGPAARLSPLLVPSQVLLTDAITYSFDASSSTLSLWCCCSPHPCRGGKQCWRSSITATLQTPQSSCQPKPPISSEAPTSFRACYNHLAYLGHRANIPASIPARPAADNRLPPLLIKHLL